MRSKSRLQKTTNGKWAFARDRPPTREQMIRASSSIIEPMLPGGFNMKIHNSEVISRTTCSASGSVDRSNRTTNYSANHYRRN